MRISSALETGPSPKATTLPSNSGPNRRGDAFVIVLLPCCRDAPAPAGGHRCQFVLSLPISPSPLVAESARRIVAPIDRHFQVLVFFELPELADVGVGLDDGVPELVLLVAEHLLPLDLLDVDVLHRIAHVVEADRPANRVELH